MKEIFYFIRDKDHKPVISVCLLIETSDSPPGNLKTVAARGVAICSDRDTPCSKLHAHQSNGPGIALRRAWKAWKSEKDMYEINREEVVKILDHVRVDNKNIEADIIFINMYGFKAFYSPEPSPKEQRILEAIK
jgi:hypothetical protein